MAEAFIVAAVRTAGGKLAGWHPAEMGAEVLDALVERTWIDPRVIEDVILGCVTQAGEQAFAFVRNVVLASRLLPDSVPAATIDRQCGSSQQAVQFAAQAVMSGTQDVVIAAGAESMTRGPMFSNHTLHNRDGIGTGPVSDRITARYGVSEFSQFKVAEMITAKYDLNRQSLDRFALESHEKAVAVTNHGEFQSEIVPLAIEGGIHDTDEGIRADASLAGIASVKSLTDSGIISAANSSQICDGASGAFIVSERALKQYDLTPIARIVNMTVTAGDPVIMLEEPISATSRVLQRAGLKIDGIDLFQTMCDGGGVANAIILELL